MTFQPDLTIFPSPLPTETRCAAEVLTLLARFSGGIELPMLLHHLNTSREDGDRFLEPELATALGILEQHHLATRKRHAENTPWVWRAVPACADDFCGVGVEL